MVAEAVGSHGRLDVLVTAAGVWQRGSAQATTEAQWDRVVEIDLRGAFFACRYAIPALIDTGGSSWPSRATTGSSAGRAPLVYNAAKFGVNGIVCSLALELAAQGVRVNSVCPADVNTPMLAGQARDFGNGRRARLARSALGDRPPRRPSALYPAATRSPRSWPSSRRGRLRRSRVYDSRSIGALLPGTDGGVLTPRSGFRARLDLVLRHHPQAINDGLRYH